MFVAQDKSVEGRFYHECAHFCACDGMNKKDTFIFLHAMVQIICTCLFRAHPS